MKKLIVISFVLFAATIWTTRAGTIVMNGNDALNTSSFNSGQNWTGGATPVTGNAYQTSTFLLRTPAGTANITFAGDSLEIQSGGDLRDKTAATVTISNFILDDGSTVELTQPNNVNNATAAGNLAGGITISGTTAIHAGIVGDVAGETFTISAIITGTGGFTTAGSTGNVILTATNSYSGTTTVNGGSLLVNGKLTGSAVTITSGTFGGNGTILGAVTNQAGGTLQPGLGGTDTSTLTISNNLMLAGTTVMMLNRGNAQNAAKIAGLSTLTQGGTLTVTNAGAALQLGDTFTLFSATNYTGSFGTLNLPTLTSGLSWNNNLAANGTLAVVPAPPAGAGVWTNDANGLWSATANWMNGTVANGKGSNANFSAINITADRTVTLDSSRTIGNLLFGDISGLQNWFLNASGGSALTLAVNSGSPTITVNNNTATINAPLAGTTGLTSTGAGTLVLGGNNTYSGVTTVNVGTLNVSGTVASTGNTIVGTAAGNAVLNVSGTLSPYFTIVGMVSGSVGAIYQTGGTINAAVNSGYENLSLGNIAGSFGYFDAAGGTYSTYGIAVGGEDNNGTTANFGVATGNGIFEVNGGTVNNTGWIVGSRSPAAQISEVNVFSGSLTFAAGGFVNNWGAGQTTMINILGGTLATIANNGIGFNGGTGVVNLLGGVTTVSAITGAGAPLNGQISFNGGTLQASGATAALLSVGSAYVYPGGGTLDDNGNAVTVAQPLLAPTGNGIYSIASFTGGAGYIAPPIITINNAGSDTTGSGATAIAQINPVTGVVTNVIITCPGVNYTATPIFVTSGGGATTQAAITGGSLSPNSSGGLTVTGGGTLTLAGANTYTGKTVVNNGTLLVTGSLAGGAISANGGILGGSGTINGVVTNQAGGTLQPGLGGGDTSTLAINNNLVLAGTTVITLNRNYAQNASTITGIATLQQGGILIVTNVGTTLQADDSFTLFNAATRTGAFSVTNLPALATGLIWTNLISVNGTISVLSTLPPGTPLVANLAANFVLATSANLNGQVLSTGGQIPGVTIYYGTTNGGTNASAWANSINLGSENATFAAPVSGLATNTTYYFTAFAANTAGSSWATPSQSFTTLAANPTVTRIPVTTYHYDNTRQAMNTNETLLTLANVNTNTFGKLFSYAVDVGLYT